MITELGVGEALVSVLDDKGMPSVVERALIYPPRSRFAPLSPEERQALIRQSRRLWSLRAGGRPRVGLRKADGARGTEHGSRRRPATSQAAGILGAMAKSAAHAMGTQLGRQLIRGVLGSFLGSNRRR